MESTRSQLGRSSRALWPPAPPKQNCTLAAVQQKSRWEFLRLPKTWVEPCRSGCTPTPVRHCQKNSQNRAEQSEGKDPHRDEPSDLGTKHLTSERSELLLRLVNKLLLCVRLRREISSVKIWIRMQMANLVRTGRG